MLARSDTVGSKRLHPVRNTDCAADWIDVMMLELRASSTTHCLMEERREEPGCRSREAGEMCSEMATWNCKDGEGGI